MSEQPAKGRRPRERQAAPPAPPATDQPTPDSDPEPLEATSRPELRAPQQPPAPAETNASILREQPAVAYTLVFALLALLLLCAFSIYMAAH